MRLRLAVMFWAIALPAHAETALQVYSWFKDIAEHSKALEYGNWFMKSTFDNGYCWGAFATIQELSGFMEHDTKRHILAICLPDGSGRMQIIKVFTRYVDEHPELSHQEFSIVALNSLVKAYRCPEFSN
jgi:hypothetical protein